MTANRSVLASKRWSLQQTQADSEREVTDFGAGGEISARPTARPSLRELGEYNYFRRNVAGVQREWWFHRSGCRAWFIAERDTRTNEVLLTELPGQGGGAA